MTLKWTPKERTGTYRLCSGRIHVATIQHPVEGTGSHIKHSPGRFIGRVFVTTPVKVSQAFTSVSACKAWCEEQFGEWLELAELTYK